MVTVIAFHKVEASKRWKAFKSFLDSPEGSEAKAADGVKSETMKVLNEVSQP
jgi:hypothetical protein